MLFVAELNFFTKTIVTLFSSFKMQTYFGLIMYLTVTILICSLLAVIAYLLSLSSVQDSEKKSEYECGFEPFDSATRLPFDVHFYLVGILFLIFDVEIALLFPWVLSLNSCGWFGFYIMIAFILLLSIGFLYEWKRGALIWPSRQREIAYAAVTCLYNRPRHFIIIANPDTYIPEKYLVIGGEVITQVDITGLEIARFGLSRAIMSGNYEYIFNSMELLLLVQEVKAEQDFSDLIMEFYIGAKQWDENPCSNYVSTAVTYFSKSSSAEIRSLLFPVLAETTLALMILYVVIMTALSLNGKHIKKNLALEALNASIISLAFIFIILEIELMYGITQIIFNGYAITNLYTTSMKMLILTSVFFVMVSSNNYIKKHQKDLMEYPMILTLALFFMLLLVSANNLIGAFFCIVGFSLNLYVLILFDAPEATAREAGIKYYYLSTFSSGLILYGIFLVFLILKTGNFKEINQILLSAPALIETNIFSTGINLIIIGIFFKLSAFPGHLWAAEVYEGSPDVITAFFMLPVKITVLVFLMQLLGVALEPAKALWQPLLIFSAVTSMLWGCFAATFEKKTKRFLAYASINQIGFLFIGLCSASIEGYRATIIYLFIYTIMNISFLTIFLNTTLKNGEALNYLTDFRGLGVENWLINWTLAVTMFSMAGIPPLAGFFGKFYLILHAQEQKLYFTVFIALATSLVSAYYYLRIIKIIWFEKYTNARKVLCHFFTAQYLILFAIETLLFIFIVAAIIFVNKSDTLAVSLIKSFF